MAFWKNVAFRRVLAALLLLWAAPSLPVWGGEAGVDLRVVDETAPPGGLAVVLIELTEPKPISRGRIRLSTVSSPLGDIVGAAILDTAGGTSSNVISLGGEVVMEFSSPAATLGVDPQLPFMVVAIEVRPTAQPGQSVPLQLDLSQSEFFDPQDQPYPEQTKPGTFTVGGLCVTNVTPLTGFVQAGAAIQIAGVGFDPEVDVNIQGAQLGAVQVLSPNEIRATLDSPFEIRGSTRFRLRNPDDSEDFFYPAVLIPPGGGGNTPPAARDDFLTTLEDTPIVINPAENDSDPDGDELRVVSVGQPPHGSAVVLNPEQVRYTPARDYHGSDAFLYTIEDAGGARVSGSVSVTVEPVNDPPTAIPDQIITDLDSPVTFFPLDNDFDVDSDPLTLISASPAAGTVFVNAEGAVTYIPHPLFEGADVFAYEVSDGQGGVSAGQIEVQVRDRNQPPSAFDDVASTAIDEPVEIALLANDSDLDDDALQVEVESQPAQGSVQVDVQGVARYQPAAGFQGVDSFQYRIRDGAGLTDTASVTIVVNGSFGMAFEPGRLELPTGGSERLSLRVDQSPAQSASTAAIELESSPPGIVQHPAVLFPEGENPLFFPIFAVRPGSAVLTAVAGSARVSIPLAALPGKVFEIPSLGESPELQLGLALSNRSPLSAQVRLRGYSDGETANESRLDVAARAQSAFVFSELDGSAASSWVEISTLERDVFPLFLYFAGPIGGFAGASATPKADSWVFPFSPSSNGQRVRLGLVNNNFADAEVNLEWRPEDGSAQAITETVKAQDALSGDLGEIFPGWEAAPGSLLLQSSQPLNSYVLASTDSYLAGQSPGSAAAALHVPHVVSGGGWRTQLNLANSTEQDQLVELRLRVESGDPPGPVELAIPAGSSRFFEVGELFGFDPEQVREGSVTIEGQGRISASALLSRGDRPGAMTPALTRLFTEAVFSQAVSGPIQGIDLFTGIAFDNVDSQDAVVIVDVYSTAGQLLGHSPFLLPAKRRKAQLLRELVNLSEPVGGGYLRVRSSRPLALAVLLGDSGLSFLSSVDAAPR